MDLYPILILAGMLDCITVIVFYFIYNRTDWTTVDGTIIKTWVEKTRGGKYKPVVEYEYQVRGQKYSNTKIAVLTPVMNSESGAQKVCQRYTSNPAVLVYHDPLQPEQSVLNPNLPFPFVIMLAVGIGLILVGTVGYLF